MSRNALKDPEAPISPRPRSPVSNEYNIQVVRQSEGEHEYDDNNDEDDYGDIPHPSEQRRPLLIAMPDDKHVKKPGAADFAHHSEAVWNEEGRESAGAYVPRGRCI